MLNGVQQGKTLDQSNGLVDLRNKVHALQAERFKFDSEIVSKLVSIKTDLICKYGFSIEGAEAFIVSASNSSLAQCSFENEEELDKKEALEDEEK